MKILVAEPMAAAGLELLRSQPGWEVIASNPKEYMQHLAEADALDRAQRRQGDQTGARAGAQAARHRPRRRRAWTTSICRPPRPRACWS